jgi:hypothetical protein
MLAVVVKPSGQLMEQPPQRCKLALTHMQKCKLCQAVGHERSETRATRRRYLPGRYFEVAQQQQVLCMCTPLRSPNIRFLVKDTVFPKVSSERN